MPTRSILLSVLAFFFTIRILPAPAWAATAQTHISTESHVSNATSTNATTQTDIIMEVNGEKQEYHSNSGDDVTITSKDGKSTVTVNNSGTSPHTSPKPSATIRPSQTPMPSQSPSPASPSATPKPQKEYLPAAEHSFFFSSFFRWLQHLFR